MQLAKNDTNFVTFSGRKIGKKTNKLPRFLNSAPGIAAICPFSGIL